MDTRTLLVQLARSLFARRKKWIVLTTLASLTLLVPAAYLLSKEPPRYQTVATVLIENKADRAPVFQEFSPYRPLPVQLAILQSRLLAASVVEALPRAVVDDLTHNPYGRDYWGEFQEWIRRLRSKESPVSSPQRRAVAELQRDQVRDFRASLRQCSRATRAALLPAPVRRKVPLPYSLKFGVVEFAAPSRSPHHEAEATEGFAPGTGGVAGSDAYRMHPHVSQVWISWLSGRRKVRSVPSTCGP